MFNQRPCCSSVKIKKWSDFVARMTENISLSGCNVLKMNLLRRKLLSQLMLCWAFASVVLVCYVSFQLSEPFKCWKSFYYTEANKNRKSFKN